MKKKYLHKNGQKDAKQDPIKFMDNVQHLMTDNIHGVM